MRAELHQGDGMRLSGAALLAIALAYLAPAISPSLPHLSFRQAHAAAMLVAVWALKRTLAASRGRTERRFWTYLTASLAVSCLVTTAVELLPLYKLPWRNLGVDAALLCS